MIKSNCEYCGKVKEYKYPSWVKRFCSYTCARLGSPKIAAAKDTLTCEYCEDDFEIQSSKRRAREKNGRKIRYCSKKCEGKSRRTRELVSCKSCGKEFEATRNIYCSAECSHQHQKEMGIRKKKGYWYENGYKVLYTSNGQGIKKHRKIMENHLGRKLKNDEIVHHINGDRLDNRIENLQVMSWGEHSRLHRLQEIAEGKEPFGN